MIRLLRPRHTKVLLLLLLASLACAGCDPSEAQPWSDAGTFRRARRSLLQSPATVVPGAAAIGIIGQAPATCWDSSNGATVISAKCSGARTQKWDLTSAGEIRPAGTSTCVVKTGSNHVVLGPCTGGLETKWNFASDGVNFGPIKHQATRNAATVGPGGNITAGSFRGQANQLFNGVGKAIDAWTANVDSARTGWYATETKLTPATVTAASFGRLADVTLDGQMYAHPLVLNAVPAGPRAASSITRNVLITASMANTLSAWDADDPSVLLWSVNLGPPLPANTYPNYGDIVGPIGIVSTPVVDRVNSVVYCVTTTLEGSVYRHRVHMLDIRTGVKLAGSGVAVAGSVPGTASPQDPNRPGYVIFQSLYHLQRPALLLAQGQVWLAFGSYNDRGPYHGWIFTYAIQTLAPGAVFCATPNGQEGAIWIAGNGLAFDGTHVFATTSNNNKSGAAISDPTNNAEATLKLTLQGHSLTVSDYFRPSNYTYLDTRDADYGTAGTMLVPGTRLGVANDKVGQVYVLNLDNLGRFQANGKNTQIPQTFKLPNSMFNAPAFAGGYLYIQPKSSPALAYQLTGTKFAMPPLSSGVNNGGGGYGTSGGSLTISGTGASSIVWGSSSASAGPVLTAYSQRLDKVLWSSSVKAADALKVRTKFSPPVVANGKVYIMSDTATLTVYGLK